MADPEVLKRLKEIAWMHRDGYMCASSCDTCYLVKLTRALLASQGGACWLIWSNYHRAYWGPNGGGYSDVAGAGRYTLGEALSWAGRRSVDPSDPRSNPPELVVPAPELIAILHPDCEAKAKPGMDPAYPPANIAAEIRREEMALPEAKAKLPLPLGHEFRRCGQEDDDPYSPPPDECCCGQSRSAHEPR